jgi:hypothetical protein
MLKSGSFEGPVMFANVKKNKICSRSSSGLPLFLWMFIFIMLGQLVWLWKWGSKYLKEEIRCWESSGATVQSSNPKCENDEGGIIGGVSGNCASGGIGATSGSKAGAPAGFRAAGARERLSMEEARWWAFFMDSGFWITDTDRRSAVQRWDDARGGWQAALQ